LIVRLQKESIEPTYRLPTSSGGKGYPQLIAERYVVARTTEQQHRDWK